MESSFLSIIPPIIIIALVIITRKIVLSLGIGVIVATLVLNNGQISQSFSTLIDAIVQIFYSDGSWNSGNFYILSFLLLLGVLTGLITALGGNRAFGALIGRRVKTKRGAQLMTATCGISLFPDDVFNMFVTSQITTPVIDHTKVPRTKLAYIIHSTSDPTCVLCPLSSWGAYIIAILTSIFTVHNMTGSPLMAFMIIATTNFYAISTLLFVFSSAAFDINIGKMGQQLDNNEESQTETEQTKGNIWDLIIPVSILIFIAVAMMMITGYKNSDSFNISQIFSNSEVSLSLMSGALFASIAGFILFARQAHAKTQHLGHLPAILTKGLKTTVPAVEILIYAWVLSYFIGELGTGEYLAHFIEQTTLPVSLLPFILFLLTGAMAFSTGTSWGTFAIMLPIAAQIASASDPSIMFFLMSAVLSGSLFGDHCSPVSDTTTVASVAAGCTQIQHVTTQLPYALICASITAVSFLLLGLTEIRIIPYAFIIISLAAVVVYFMRKQQQLPKNERETFSKAV
ncbi:MAG: Na+/H+ antiporter NhaC family protein [Bacillus sp. (in: firmicutes)]